MAEWEFLGPLRAAREKELEEGGAPQYLFGGHVYPDGSCSCEAIRELRRAGCGAVEVNDDGEPLRKFTMPVPRSFRQTPQAAEHIGYATTLRALGKRATIKPDCMAVVRAANQPLNLALAASKRYAGITMDARSDPVQLGLVDDVKWVKAHRPLTGNEGPDERRDILGNKAADDAAREGRERHPPLPKELEQSIDFHVKRAPHIIRAVGTALEMFPPVEQRMQRPPRPRNAQEAKERKVHWWRFSAGSWRCAVCSSWIASHRLPRSNRRETCKGPPMDHKLAEFTGNGHRLCRTAGDVPIIFCSKCGAWSSKRPRKLKRRCAAITPPGRQALARLARGLCPWAKRTGDGSLLQRSRLRHAAAYDGVRGDWREVSNRGIKRRSGGDCTTAAAEAARANKMTKVDQDVVMTIEDSSDIAYDTRDVADQGQPACDVVGTDAMICESVDARPGDADDHELEWNRAEEQYGSRTACRKPTATEEDLVGTTEEALSTALRDSMATRQPGREEPYGRGRWAVFNAATGIFLVADLGDIEKVRDRIARTRWLNNGEEARPGCSTVGTVPTKDGGRAEQAGVQAKDAASILTTAREGPGDPPDLCVTAASTAPVSERVAAVAREGVVGTLLFDDHAREAHGAERGEPTSGPPSGRAAPLEDSGAATGEPQGCESRSSPQRKPPAAGGVGPQRWREQNSPRMKPADYLGAGPRGKGDALSDEQGTPPRRRTARRRDGSGETRIVEAVARGSGAATARGDRERLLRSLACRSTAAPQTECELDPHHYEASGTSAFTRGGNESVNGCEGTEGRDCGGGAAKRRRQEGGSLRAELRGPHRLLDPRDGQGCHRQLQSREAGGRRVQDLFSLPARGRDEVLDDRHGPPPTPPRSPPWSS